MRRKFKNGILSLFKKYAVRSFDGQMFHIDDQVYDVLQTSPIGRIEMFISEYGYIKAVVKGVPIDIDEIFKQ